MILFRRKGLAFNSIIYFINYIKSKITGDISQSIKYLDFFQIVEIIICLIGLTLFIYPITNILLLLKEKNDI